MPSDAERDALEDIRDNVYRAMRFVEGLDFDAFLADDKTFYAVTRCLEIVSEASRRLPAALKTRFPEIPWNKVAGSGNIYRHGYEHVQERRVWATVQDDLPPLLDVVEAVLRSQSPEHDPQNFT